MRVEKRNIVSEGAFLADHRTDYAILVVGVAFGVVVAEERSVFASQVLVTEHGSLVAESSMLAEDRTTISEDAILPEQCADNAIVVFVVGSCAKFVSKKRAVYM